MIRKYIFEKVLRGVTKSRDQFMRDFSSKGGEKWDVIYPDKPHDLFLCRMNPPMPEKSRNRVVIYSHGNFQDVSEEEVKMMCRCISEKTNAYVYAYEYPGYVEGYDNDIHDNVELNMIYVSRLAYQSVINIHENVPLNINVVGFSLGAFMAIQMVMFSQMLNHKIENLILVSPFASCISTRTPCYIAESMFKNVDCFDNKKYIARVDCNVFFIHGQKDQIVKTYNSKYLHWLLNKQKRLSISEYIEIEDKKHNDMVLGNKAYDFLSDQICKILFREN